MNEEIEKLKRQRAVLVTALAKHVVDVLNDADFDYLDRVANWGVFFEVCRVAGDPELQELVKEEIRVSSNWHYVRLERMKS